MLGDGRKKGIERDMMVVIILALLFLGIILFWLGRRYVPTLWYYLKSMRWWG